jgi:hypothetical protein
MHADQLDQRLAVQARRPVAGAPFMRQTIAVVLGCLLIGAGAAADRFMLGSARAAPAGDPADLRQELAEVRSALEDVRRSVDRAGVGTKTVFVPPPPVAANANACASDAKPQDEAKRLEQQRNHPSWQDAEALVTAAIARGRWTEADILRFRELARDATDIDMVPLMQRIDVAINTRRLRPDPDLVELH